MTKLSVETLRDIQSNISFLELQKQELTKGIDAEIEILKSVLKLQNGNIPKTLIPPVSSVDFHNDTPIVPSKGTETWKEYIKTVLTVCGELKSKEIYDTIFAANPKLDAGKVRTAIRDSLSQMNVAKVVQSRISDEGKGNIYWI